MGEQKNILVINGQTYNSKTGIAAPGLYWPIKSSGASTTKVLDGFIRRHAVAPQHPKVPVKPHQKRHKLPAHKIHHKSEKASTLMRSAVAKPVVSKPKALSSRLESSESTPKLTIPNYKNQLSFARAAHSKKVPKSSSIKRFNLGEPAEFVFVKTTLNLPVKPKPNEQKESAASTSISDVQSDTKTDIFTQALSHASSHEQARPKKNHRHKKAKKLGVSRRAYNISAAVLVVLVLGGFIAYQNMANINMRMAASRAGIHASLPGYHPAGFAINRHVQAAPGQVTLSLHSNSDDRNFVITQTSSDWNSQSLQDNYVAAADQNYQKIDENNGKTVFVYDQSNASWVDSGIWYKIEGNSSLSNDQLLKIANSF